MKVSGSLVGITLYPIARARFFLTAPELACLAEEAKSMAGVTAKVHDSHHSLAAAVISREERNIHKLIYTIISYLNPFTVSDNDLFNLITKVIVPDNVRRDRCAQKTEGEKLLNNFVTERIQKGTVSVWSQMKKCKLLTWKSTGKKIKVTANNQIVELQEDRSLFARMTMVCRTRPDIDVQEAVGVHEFTEVPRAVFAADGSMLHCPNKSALMTLIENEAQALFSREQQVARKVDITDGMAELSSLDKPPTILTCAYLAEHFVDRMFQKHSNCDELHLVLDNYDIPLSLKLAIRVRMTG